VLKSRECGTQFVMYALTLSNAYVRCKHTNAISYLLAYVCVCYQNFNALQLDEYRMLLQRSQQLNAEVADKQAEVDMMHSRIRYAYYY
jgi:hypothetical protein